VAAGVQVPGGAFVVDDIRPRPVLTAETLIAGHMSSPLSAIVRPLLKDSINLYAEAVMRLNAVPADVPTNDAALGGLRARLTAWNVPPDGVQLVDGSGLSRRSVIAPEALLAVLARMHDPTGRSPFVAALPVAGVDGSLARRMKGTAAEGRVLAKTGTMSNIRTLAGYATTAEGEHLAFVILLNNFEGTGTEATDAVDRMAVRIASFRRVGP
jgi:D-alanyl-D-alanine carboxypeptidase/D-alanyl-D-alanine-endopeptidase (penicillin-binding protein 4)